MILLLILALPSARLLAQSLSSPVSIVFDKTNNRYLIANTGSNSILAMDMSRKLTTFMDTGIFSIGRMTIVGDVLYYIDGGKVVGLDLTDRSVKLDAIVGTALSDIAADNNGNLYLGDYNVDLIYKVLVSTGTVSEYMKNAVSGVTGLAYDEKTNRLLVSSFKTDAPIESVNLSSSVISTLYTTNMAWINSLEVDSNGHIFIAVQDSQAVYYYSPDFSNGPVAIAKELQGVEDIYYNVEHDSLVIVCGGDNTIKIVAVPEYSSVKEHLNSFSYILYPNPANEMINIQLSLLSESFVKIVLTDLQGKSHYSMHKHFAQGKNALNIILSEKLPAGLYLLNMDVNGEKSTTKIMIQ